MLKLDTGLINPIEREKTSHGVLWLLDACIIFLLLFVQCVFIRDYIHSSDLRQLLRRISDRIHDAPADTRVSGKSRMSVSMSCTESCSFQRLYVRFSGRLRHWIQVRPYTGATLCRRYICAVILPDVPGRQMGRL